MGLFADSDRLPVLVELGRLPVRYLQPEGGEIPNWIQFLPEYLSARLAYTKTPPQLLTQALADGRCLLLFDSLDEVADRQARARLAHSLAELAHLFPGNRVIIGSRPSGVSESEGALYPQFQRCQIERFTPEDVLRFFRFWYALDHGLTLEQQHEAADALYARVQATRETLQLATTPLLSTILLLIWRNEGKLPERRVELYERCCSGLIKQWEAHHMVAYKGLLDKVGWECHLRLLTPLAYSIHTRKQTSATRAELIPKLAKGLQKEGLCSNQDESIRVAELFLETLSLRSGLLQYTGVDESNQDRYGFPHQTFQEYLTARYIAAQPDPEYIDLVMVHLHEAWWQQVHLLTIAHLGSGEEGASKASALILTILNVYAPPNWILRSSKIPLLRRIEPGRLLPQVQLDRRIAWIQAREFELATKGYMECMLDGTTAKVGTVLSAHAAVLERHILNDQVRCEEQKALLTLAGQLSQHKGNEAVVSAMLAALHDADWSVRERAAESLGQIGVSDEAVLSAWLAALQHTYWFVREQAAATLSQMEIKDPIQLRQALLALYRCLHDFDDKVRHAAMVSIRQLLDGRSIPGYHWVLLQKRQARLRSLKRIAILTCVVAVLLLIALTFTLLDPTNLIARWVTWLSILASIVSVIGVTLRDLWKRKQSNQVQVFNGD